MSRKKRERKRRKHWFKRQVHPKTMPGAVHAAPEARPLSIHVIAYDTDGIEEHRGVDAARLRTLIGRHRVTWVNVEGLGDPNAIEEIGKLFGLHALALEDVVHVHQRAKVEDYQNHLYITSRMVSFKEHLETEQISIFLGDNFVVSFLEDPGDCFDSLRDRLRRARGRTRTLGPDYLAYAILDAVIDSYFPVLDAADQKLNELDDQIAEGAGHGAISPLHEIRNELRLLRRSIGPHREAINELLRDHHPLIGPETRIHLRDCYDHTVQIIDATDIYREMCNDMRDFHVSMLSIRTNDIMKVLTIISTIFIPLGFVAGVYGMNFNTDSSPWNMPELKWFYGYPFALGLMGAIVVGLLFFIWRKGWLHK